MTKGSDILNYLMPTGGWVIYGDDFDSIIYDNGVIPITKKQFDDTSKIIKRINADRELAKETTRQEILDRLGLTADEAKLILG